METKVKFSVDRIMSCFAGLRHLTFTSPSIRSSVHIIWSTPKSQYWRIKRIFTNINDYWKHAHAFVHHYIKRGYNHLSLKETANVQLDKSNFHA